MRILHYFFGFIFFLLTTVGALAQTEEFTGNNDINLILVSDQVKHEYISGNLKGAYNKAENQFEFFTPFTSFNNTDTDVDYFSSFVELSNVNPNAEQFRIYLPLEESLIDLSEFEGEHQNMKAIVSFGDVQYTSTASMAGYYNNGALIYTLTIETLLTDQLEYELMQTYLPPDLTEIDIIIKDARMINVLGDR